MKIVQINSLCGQGSTGKICVQISRILSEHNVENYVLYSRGKSEMPNAFKCSNGIYTKCQAFKAKVFGNYGFNSRLSTNKIIFKLRKIKPDVVLLHNIHSHDCDLGSLFSFFNKKRIKVYWTFHDCWAFTAYCPYFSFVKCDKWKYMCTNCPSFKEYSFFFDRSSVIYKRKKEALKNIDLTVITPSLWLAKLVGESFLKDYPIKVINNGIDLSIFKPTSNSIRTKYNIPVKKKIILGVAFCWGPRKGLDVFIELDNRLDPEEYQIMLVGTTSFIDEILPNNIISIHKTCNQQELAEIYSSADLFVNPTREDNYPTVNMEAIACGTPVLTFDTGGSSEMIDATCGNAVKCDDIDSLEKEIKRVCNSRPYSVSACIKKAKEFDQRKRFLEYVNLMLNESNMNKVK